MTKNANFPPEWHVTTTPTDWSNEATILEHIEKIINPYIIKKREELNLDLEFPALVLFYHFTGQITQVILERLEKYHIMYVLIPNTCTDQLHPMDLSINKPFKDQLKQSFHSWYASQVLLQFTEVKTGSQSLLNLLTIAVGN